MAGAGKQLDLRVPGRVGSGVPGRSAPAARGQIRRRRAALSIVGLLALAAGFCLPVPQLRAAEFETALPLRATPLLLERLDAGGKADLGDSRGRVVLLHFFATWCEPCRPEMASLARLAARFPDLAVLAVSVAEVNVRVERFFSEAPVPFPILMDRDRRASRAWEVVALPTTYLLDRASTPRLQVRGDLDWQRPDVEAQIAGLLAEPTDTPRPSNPASTSHHNGG